MKKLARYMIEYKTDENSNILRGAREDFHTLEDIRRYIVQRRVEEPYMVFFITDRHTTEAWRDLPEIGQPEAKSIIEVFRPWLNKETDRLPHLFGRGYAIHGIGRSNVDIIIYTDRQKRIIAVLSHQQALGQRLLIDWVNIEINEEC